jgi:SOS-response transcriptional repressor LexA
MVPEKLPSTDAIRAIYRRRPEPTALQHRIMAFVRKYQAGDPDHCSPTYAEIGRAVGIASKATIHKNVKRLQDIGWIEPRDRRHRSIVIANEHGVTIDFPDDLWAELMLYAIRMGVSPGVIVIEAMRDAMPELRKRFR